MKATNPFAFRCRSVGAIVTIVYLAFSVGLIYVGCTVPQAPKHDVPFSGVNLTEAFVDLQDLTKWFHPYNSRRNDKVRNWLLSRTGMILEENGVEHAIVQTPDEGPPKGLVSPGSAAAVIFNDLLSNVSFSGARMDWSALSNYFEGTNIIVYIRGKDDVEGAWWDSGEPYSGPKGVLVNAHYDSVSTGYGATDDGVGVVTVLQLLKYFSTKGHQPKHGILFLLNNGEEDFLNGAYAFTQHPLSKFPDRFLNLEGAGAGGRAAMFRTTDTEVTRYYQRAKHPFATSMSDDGFKAGLLKSETDYRVFYGDLGMRGLDIAFIEPRSRYHTVQDDSRHTSRDSVWHMLDSALPTMQGLANSELDEGKRSDAAWFDLFGRTFAVMELHTLFALQVTLLVLAPVSITAMLVVLQRQDKLYLLSRYRFIGESKARMGGLKGLFRGPIIFTVSSGCTIAVAFLFMETNPFIVVSSPWAVWACFVSLWVFASWFQSRFVDYVRPTALHRVYTLLWLHLGSWVLGVVAAVYENRGMSIGYPILFYELGFWLATLLALSELLAVTKQSTFAADQLGITESPVLSAEDAPVEEPEETEPTEQTALLNQETTFRPRSRRTENASVVSYLDCKPPNVYKYEQFWSEKIPSTLWILEFLLSSIPALVFIGPLIPFVTSALTQTLSDGGGTGVYLYMAILSILFLAPIQPYVHRFTFHVPSFLFLVFVGTLVYNLVAFPFSTNNRFKMYFAQKVDLDTGLNQVVLSGVRKSYIKQAIADLPSVAGNSISLKRSARIGLVDASWPGDAPTVVLPKEHADLPPELAYEHWLTVNVTRAKDPEDRTANITIVGQNTRSCKLQFNSPIRSFYVDGASKDNRPYQGDTVGGTKEVRLWRRTWETPWTVQIHWDGEKGMDGRAICMWNLDEEQPRGGIPALQEIWHYTPTWSDVTKMGDGLVEGHKTFMI